jgi:hypothetical protein
MSRRTGLSQAGVVEVAAREKAVRERGMDTLKDGADAEEAELMLENSVPTQH